MKVLVSLTVFCVLQSNLALANDSDNVDYSKQDEWGGECNTGYAQSPINIDTNYLTQDKNVPKLNLTIPNDAKPATATNIGDTVQFDYSDIAPLLSGAGLRDTYILKSLNFHWPSEHTVNGRHFPLEAHWVHYNERYSSLEEANKHEDGLVYFVTFYDVGAEEGLPAIDQFADATEAVANRVGLQTVVESVTFDVPEHSIAFYKYRGSIPVPPCREHVTYILLEEPVLITEAQLNKLTTVTNQDGELVKSNNRRTQPLNGRDVYYKYQ